jgi:hypothetical protein
VCSGAYQGRSVWRSEAACWQAGSPTSSAQAGRRTFEKARAERTFEKARRRNIREPNIEIVRQTRSSQKIFREDLHRDKIFKEALQRSSSEKLFTNKDREQKINMVFIAEHGSAIEGGCCDTNRTVHARG